MQSTFRLKPVPWHDYPLICQKLESKLPDSAFVYGLLFLCHKHGPYKHCPFFVYVPEEEKFNSLVFVARPVKTDLINLSAYYDEIQVSNTDLGQLFLQIPDIREKAVSFCTSPAKLKEQLMVAINTLDSDTHYFSNEDPVSETIMMVHNKTKIEAPRLPDGYVLEKLEPEDCPILKKTWLFPFLENIDHMADRITKLSGFGIYHESEKGKQLLAWTQRYTDGSIGMTRTLPEHRRKGLGRIVTLRCLEEVLSMNEYPFLFVLENEKFNFEFHRKMGFEPVSSNGWFFYLPVGKKLEDWSDK